MSATKTVNRIEAIGGEAPTNGAAAQIDLSVPFRVSVRIEGVAPLLFHRWNCEAVEEKANAAKGSKSKKTDNVESYVYRDAKGTLCLPGEYLRQSVVNAGRSMQDPRSPRKSAKDLFNAVVVNLTELAPLGAKDWDYLDKRRVVVQRNAITRSRPAMREGWAAEFVMMVNEPSYVPPALLHQALVAAGRLVGVGDFRPTYGRFNVTKFEILKD